MPTKPAAKKPRVTFTKPKTGTAVGTPPTPAPTAAVKAALAALTAAENALAPLGLESLTAVERKDSNGKLRDGEAAAMINVLDVADAFPGLFASLADKDGGVDDLLVETAPARADLATWTALAPFAAQIEALHTLISDTRMALGADAKEVTVPAYAIIRANAASNSKLAAAAAQAITFYAHAAKQRAANKAHAAAKAKAAAAKG